MIVKITANNLIFELMKKRENFKMSVMLALEKKVKP